MIDLLTILLIFLGGIANAFMDRTADPDNFAGSGLGRFRTRWFGDRLSTAGNKWKDGDRSKGERFPGSSTIFVWVTDFWHFAKFILLVCIHLALALHFSPIRYLYPDLALHPIISVLINTPLLMGIMGIPFTIVHDKVLTQSIMKQKTNFWTSLRNFLYEMKFWKAAVVVAPLFFLWIGLAEVINRLDPAFDPENTSATYLGDIIMSVVFVLTLLALAWKSFRDDKKGGRANV